jgi:hypothetical protein
MTAARVRVARMLSELLSSEAVASLVDAIADEGVRRAYGELCSRVVDAREAARQAQAVSQ